MRNALRGLTAIAIALALLTATACDDREAERARVEIGRLTAELDIVRGKRDAVTAEAETLRGELQQLKDQNAGLQAERDALEKRVKKLQAAARPAPSEAPSAAAQPSPTPAAQEEDKSLREARERVEGLASALFAREQYDLARSLALTAVQLGSKRAESHFHIAYGSADGADYAGAAKEYERAVAALEGVPDADQTLLKKCLNNWGAAAARVGEAREAEQLYLRVLTLDPGYSPAGFNLGLLYAAQPERAADAVRVLQDYIVRGGSRSTSARELILKLQPPQKAPASPAAD